MHKQLNDKKQINILKDKNVILKLEFPKENSFFNCYSVALNLHQIHLESIPLEQETKSMQDLSLMQSTQNQLRTLSRIPSQFQEDVYLWITSSTNQQQLFGANNLLPLKQVSEVDKLIQNHNEIRREISAYGSSVEGKLVGFQERVRELVDKMWPDYLDEFLTGNFINMPWLNTVLFEMFQLKLIYCEHTQEVVNSATEHSSGCFIESTSVAIVNDRAGDKLSGAQQLLVNMNGFDLIVPESGADQDQRKIDRVVKNRVFNMKLKPDLLAIEVTNPQVEEDEQGSICPRYVVTYMTGYDFNGEPLDQNNFQKLCFQKHNIYKNWSEEKKRENSLAIDQKQFMKVNTTKKVTFSNAKSGLTKMLDSVQTMGFDDRTKAIFNQSTSRHSKSAQMAQNHHLVQVLDTAKKDPLIRDKLCSVLRIQEVVADQLKFNDQTIDYLLSVSNFVYDDDLEAVEFFYLFKMFRESNELNDEELQVFYEVIYNFDNVIKINQFKVALLVLDQIYCYFDQIQDRKEIRDIDVERINQEVGEVLGQLERNNQESIMILFDLYNLQKAWCDQGGFTQQHLFELTGGRKLDKVTFDDMHHILKKCQISVEKTQLKFLLHKYDNEGIFNWKDWIIDGNYTKVKVELDQQKSKEYFQSAISKLNLNYEDFPEELKQYHRLSQLDQGSKFSIFDLRKVCAEYKPVLTENEMQAVISILDFDKKGYIILSDLIQYIYGMPQHSLRNIKDIESFKFTKIFNHIIEEANFKRKSIFDLFKLEDTQNRKQFTKSEMKEILYKRFQCKIRDTELNHLLQAYGSLHQGNLIFDQKILSEDVDTQYYLKQKKIPGAIESKAPMNQMSTISSDLQRSARVAKENMDKSMNERKKSSLNANNEGRTQDQPRGMSNTDKEQFHLKINSLQEMPLDAAQVTFSRIIQELVEQFVQWNLDPMQALHCLDSQKEGFTTIQKMKDFIDSFQIEQRQEDIQQFIFQKKYIFENQRYNQARFLDHITWRMHHQQIQNQLFIELLRQARSVSLSDLELFRELGGADDGVVSLDEFRGNIVRSSKLQIFGEKLQQHQVKELFTRMCGNEFDQNLPYDKYKLLIQEVESDVADIKTKFITRVGDYFMKERDLHFKKHKTEIHIDDVLKRQSLDDQFIEIDSMLLKLFKYEQKELALLTNMDYLIQKQNDKNFMDFKNIREILISIFGERVKISSLKAHMVNNKAWPRYQIQSKDILEGQHARMNSLRTSILYHIRKDPRFENDPWHLLNLFPERYKINYDFTQFKYFMKFLREYAKIIDNQNSQYEFRTFLQLKFDFKTQVPIRDLLSFVLECD